MLRQHNHERLARKIGRSPLVLLGCAAITAYFVQHAVHGRHGLERSQRLEARASTLAAETAKLEAVRAVLRRDIALLAAEIPDSDIVEEIARDVLGYARPGEKVLRRPAPRAPL